MSQEAEPGALGCEDETPRLDLTHLPFATIDPADARDHDDALRSLDGSRRRGHRGHRRCGRFVRPGSALDDYAARRGCSTYLPDRVLPMLPEWLSADAASLRAGVDRPVVFVRLEVDYQGDVISSDWGLGTIRSRADLNYDQVQAYIDGDAEALPDDQALRGSTTVLSGQRGCCSPLRAQGAAEIAGGELRFQVDQDEPTGVVERHQRFAERVVEMCMIAANEEVVAPPTETRSLAGARAAVGVRPSSFLALASGPSAQADGCADAGKLNKMMAGSAAIRSSRC